MPTEISLKVSRANVLAAVRAKIGGNPLDLGSPAEFAQLIEAALAASNTTSGDHPDDNDPIGDSILAAMALLGPGSGLPDRSLYDALKALVKEFCPANDHETLLDLVAAFGCGWNRPEMTYDNDWHGMWAGAFTYLTKRTDRVSRYVSHALQGRLHVRFPDDTDFDLLLTDAATLMATMLTQPVAPVAQSTVLSVKAGDADGDPVYARLSITTDDDWEETVPTGARAVYQCSDGEANDETHDIEFSAGDIIRLVSSETLSNLQIKSGTSTKKKFEKRPKAGQQFEFTGYAALNTFACTCGEDDCEQRHRLSAWDPGQEHGELQNFLYSAIRGQMQDLKAKDFAQGLLGSYWARHGFADGSRLRLAEVIHRACMNDECPERAAENSARLYLGGQCDRCGTVAGPQTPYLTRERLIFVDTELPQWELKEYWRCGNNECSNAELDGRRNTLFEPTANILKRANLCCHCGKEFWSQDQKSVIGNSFASAGTLLAGAQELERMRRQQCCDSCGKAGATAMYCNVCAQQDRPGKLPARPTWYFAQVTP